MDLSIGVAGPGRGMMTVSLMILERSTIEGDSPLSENPIQPTGIPSRSAHVKR